MNTTLEAKVSLKNNKFRVEVINRDLTYLGFKAQKRFYTYNAEITVSNLLELKNIGYEVVYSPEALEKRDELAKAYKRILEGQKYKQFSDAQIDTAWEEQNVYEKLPADPAQKRTILFALAIHKALLYLEMGIGKTYVGSVIAQQLYNQKLIKPKSVLLIAPCTLQDKENWPDELGKFCDLSHVIVSKESDFEKSADIYIMNTEKFKKFCVDDNGDYIEDNPIDRKKFDCCIFDESTKIKTHNSITTKCFLEFSKRIKYLYLMSGLPAPNTILQLWSQAAAVGGWLGDSYGHFAVRYATEQRRENYSRMIPKPNAETEIRKRIDLVSIFMKAEDHIVLPPYIIQDIEVPMPHEMDVLYQKVEHDYMMTLNSFTSKMNVAERKMYFENEASVRAKMLQVLCGFVIDTNEKDEDKRIIRLTWNPKLDKLIEHLEVLLADETNNVIIWTRFRAELDEIYEALTQKWVCAYGKGGMSKSERRAQLDLWLHSKHCRVMIAHPGAFMYGHTWNKANFNIYTSAVEDNEHYSQSRRRNYRRGQTRTVREYRYVFVGTLEKQIWKSTVNKIRLDQFLKRGL